MKIWVLAGVVAYSFLRNNRKGGVPKIKPINKCRFELVNTPYSTKKEKAKTAEILYRS